MKNGAPRGLSAGRFAAPAFAAAAGGLMLGWWAIHGLRALPFDFSDLAYLFSLEEGRWVMQEWVHPLFLPCLGFYRWALGLTGFSGRMLLPVERLNLAVGALTLTGICRAAARASGEREAGLAGAAMLGVSLGFWQGCLRPVPYAFAAAALALTLSLLAAPRPGVRRYALAGACGGVCFAFHASGLALVPVAAVMACLDGNDSRGRIRLALAFLLTFVVVGAASYPVFMADHGIGTEFFRRASFSEVFRGIEQAPESSLYTHGTLAGQAADYAATLRFQGGGMCLAVVSLAASVLVLPRREARAAPQARRLAALAAANFAAFSLFFVLNNALNGFVFASLVGLPFAVAAAARVRRGASVLAAALAALVLSRASLPDRGPLAAEQTQLLKETSFLAELAAPADVFLAPGCPFPELFYFRHFDVVRVADDSPAAERCQVPSTAAGPALAARADSYLAGGRRVFVVDGAPGGPEGRDVSGGFKSRQIFMPDGQGGPEAGRVRLEAALGARLSGARTIRSVNGWSYRELVSARRAAHAAPASSSAVPDFGAVREILSRAGPNPDVDARLAYLSRWYAAAPEDAYARADLFEALARWARRDGAGLDRDARARVLDRLLAALRGYLPERDLRAAFLAASRTCSARAEHL